jgi:hypothetical protein
VIKSKQVTVETLVEETVVTSDTLKCNVVEYSLIGFISGVVKKRQVRTVGKTCGIFAKAWSQWLTVESAFDLDLEYVCEGGCAYD